MILDTLKTKNVLMLFELLYIKPKKEIKKCTYNQAAFLFC